MSTDDFEQLLADIEREAQQEGPAAVADLRAMQLRYRLIARLIQRRHEMHLTEEQLARLSGVGQAEISQIEQGYQSPTLETYSRLATALNLSLAELLTLPAAS
jgi:DNA-binding XRE family transcriptional regulator